MRILCIPFCLSIFLPSGSFSSNLFSQSNIFLCWTCRDNRTILFTQTAPFLFFFWDTVSFLMTAMKWEFGLLNYWISMIRPFTFTYQGSSKQCAALTSLHCDCLLGCFCEISERFSPLLFHLSVFEHEPAGLHGRNAQRALRTRRITLMGRLNAIPTISFSAHRTRDHCSWLGTPEASDLIKWLHIHCCHTNKHLG